MGAGVATGMVLGAIGSRSMHHNRKFKRGAGKAIRVIGNIVDNVQHMMR